MYVTKSTLRQETPTNNKEVAINQTFQTREQLKQQQTQYSSGFHSQDLDHSKNTKTSSFTSHLQQMKKEENNQGNIGFQDVEKEQMKHVINDLLTRMLKLEERTGMSEAKIDLNERLLNLKEHKINSSQIKSLKQHIQSDVATQFQSLVTYQQEGCERTIELIRQFEMFEKKVKNNEDHYIQLCHNIECKLKETLLAHSSTVTQIVHQNTDSLQTLLNNYEDCALKVTATQQSITLLCESMHDQKEITVDKLDKLKQSIENIAKQQKKTDQEVTEHLSPTIIGLEKDLLRMLLSQKQLSESVHISQYINEEINTIKCKIKDILSNLNLRKPV